jgi:hypothetical protein
MRAIPAGCALVLLAAAALPAATLPPDGDSWSDYANWVEAYNDGWRVGCGITLQLVTPTDCQVGSSSVGCQTVGGLWQKEFWIEKTVALDVATEIVMWQKASWVKPFSLHAYMLPTPEETAAGITEKRLTWTFDTATSWTLEDFAIADGTWSWYAGMWQPTGGNMTLTELTRLAWDHYAIFPYSAGDQVLVDGLYFVIDASGVEGVDVVGERPSLSLGGPNPFALGTSIRFDLPTAGRARVTIHTIGGRHVATLVDGVMSAGAHEVEWDGTDARGVRAAAGVYVCRLEAGAWSESRRLVLIR